MLSLIIANHVAEEIASRESDMDERRRYLHPESAPPHTPPHAAPTADPFEPTCDRADATHFLTTRVNPITGWKTQCLGKFLSCPSLLLV